jgi:5-formyltetrahydrofolate cyclo-ligase
MREPATNVIIDINDISLMLVPMVGYNKNNYRLGYGLNFYNTYLDIPNKIYTIGLAYQFQYNNEFITTNYDKILDTIITN